MEAMEHYFSQVADALAVKGHLVRRTIVSGPHTGSEEVTSDDGLKLTRGTMEGNSIEEVISVRPHLFIYGGGHVALALYQLVRLGKLEVDVFDERPDWGSPERFPEATVHQGGPKEVLKEPISVPGAYAVIMTHNYDKECLEYAMTQPFSYIGMIGSATKTKIAFNSMKKRGFSDYDLRKVHAPIGLPIGGDTPSEIAVSIMAEIILHYTGGKKHHMVTDPALLRAASQATDAVLVRVLENKGSSPATPGAMILVQRDGSFIGTIGGGMIEKTAIDTAKVLSYDKVESYDMSRRGNLDMVCGGKASLLYTCINSTSDASLA